MSRIRKVYLPKWMSWFGVIFVLPTWIWVSYRVLATDRGAEDLGFGGWAIMTVVMLGVTVVLFLMGYRKLPAYVIEEDDEGDGG